MKVIVKLEFDISALIDVLSKQYQPSCMIDCSVLYFIEKCVSVCITWLQVSANHSCDSHQHNCRCPGSSGMALISMQTESRASTAQEDLRKQMRIRKVKVCVHQPEFVLQ